MVFGNMLPNICNIRRQSNRFRNFFATLTVANDLATLNHISNISDTLLAQVKGNKDLTGWTVMFQPIPSLFAQNGVARGGNVLGLPTDKNLVCEYPFILGRIVFDMIPLTSHSVSLLRLVDGSRERQPLQRCRSEHDQSGEQLHICARHR